MSKSTRRVRWLASAVMQSALICLGLVTVTAAPLWAAPITFSETGSTLLFPLFTQWIPDYARIARNVGLTAAATGSGAGIGAVIAGHVQIGASDAYMSDAQFEHNPLIINIPVAISAQTVNYNVPGLNGAGLKLSGPVLAGIYSGKITTWDAEPIAQLNPAAALPHKTIVPIRRSDASGDSFIFTQYLDFSTQTWQDKVGYGTLVDWPTVAGERTAAGNDAMVQTAAATPYSIAYIGVSFHAAIAKAGLGTALLENKNGKFLLPTVDTIKASASSLDAHTPPDERLSLVLAPGDDSYPLINYEYLMVSKQQPDADTASALRNFLQWTVSPEGGNAVKYLDSVGFIPLPDFIRALSEKQIALIKP